MMMKSWKKLSLRRNLKNKKNIFLNLHSFFSWFGILHSSQMRLFSLELIREPVHCSECKFSFTVNVNFPSFFFEPTPKFHWNSDLMQVQGMGTRPSVFSINKKEITQFLERFHCTGRGGIRTRDLNGNPYYWTWTSYQWRHGTVDKNLCFEPLYIDNIWLKIRNDVDTVQ